MAAYGISITDSGDGSFVLSKIMRGATVTTITGGTDITPQRASGDAVGTTTGWTFQVLGDAIAKAAIIAVADRSKNG